MFDAKSDDGLPWTASRLLRRAQGGGVSSARSSDLDAWVTGLRREQAPTRAAAPKLGWDEAHGLWKVSPLADWSEKEVWRYIAEHDLPYNPLHDQGYASIGCAPCTLPGGGREGRWAGRSQTECGLHGDE